MISESFTIRKYIAWYAFRILCHKKVYCLARFQDPVSWECTLPGMTSGSSIIIMYIAWYDFRILLHNNVYAWAPDSISLLGGVLECVSAPPGKTLQIWSLSSNDYHSKNRIEILCKNPVWMPRDLLSQPDFSRNFWDHRTLARMSTWTARTTSKLC